VGAPVPWNDTQWSLADPFRFNGSDRGRLAGGLLSAMPAPPDGRSGAAGPDSGAPPARMEPCHDAQNRVADVLADRRRRNAAGDRVQPVDLHVHDVGATACGCSGPGATAAPSTARRSAACASSRVESNVGSGEFESFISSPTGKGSSGERPPASPPNNRAGYLGPHVGSDPVHPVWPAKVRLPPTRGVCDGSGGAPMASSCSCKLRANAFGANAFGANAFGEPGPEKLVARPPAAGPVGRLVEDGGALRARRRDAGPRAALLTWAQMTDR